MTKGITQGFYWGFQPVSGHCFAHGSKPFQTELLFLEKLSSIWSNHEDKIILTASQFSGARPFMKPVITLLSPKLTQAHLGSLIGNVSDFFPHQWVQECLYFQFDIRYRSISFYERHDDKIAVYALFVCPVQIWRSRISTHYYVQDFHSQWRARCQVLLW